MKKRDKLFSARKRGETQQNNNYIIEQLYERKKNKFEVKIKRNKKHQHEPNKQKNFIVGKMIFRNVSLIYYARDLL